MTDHGLAFPVSYDFIIAQCGCALLGDGRTPQLFCRRHDPAAADRMVAALTGAIRACWRQDRALVRVFEAWERATGKDRVWHWAYGVWRGNRAELRALLRIRRAGRRT